MKLDFCVACGTKQDLQHHHLKPRSDGGTDDETNLVTLCQECHAIYHNLNFRDHGHLTRLGLERAKARGVKLGSPLNPIRAEDARKFAATIKPHVDQLRKEGTTSWNAMAKALNDLGITSATGGKWYQKTLQRCMGYIEL